MASERSDEPYRFGSALLKFLAQEFFLLEEVKHGSEVVDFRNCCTPFPK